MKFTKLILLGICFATLTTCERIEVSKNAISSDAEDAETFSPEIEQLFEKIRNGLKDIYRRTSDVTQSLQENVVEVVNEGREKLHILKEEIRTKISDIKCDVEFEPELKEFVRETKDALNACTGEVFQSSEEYRRKVKDDIEELESGFYELRKMIKNCFITKNVDLTECYYDQVNEYNRMSDEIISEFDEIYHNSRENAVEVLSNLMDCNKNVLKDARKKQKAKLLNCVQSNEE